MTTAAAPPNSRQMPPVLGRLVHGTVWLALRTPLQAVFVFWSSRLILEAIGKDQTGAYQFAWGFGFLQFLLEFGISSALQRQISENWTQGDHEGVDRAIACGMNFYAAMALVQIAALLGIAYWALPHSHFIPGTPAYHLIVKLLWLQAATAPCYGLSVVVSSVLQAARRYDFIPRFEVGVVILRFLVLWIGLSAGVDFFLVVVTQTAVQILLSLGPAIWVMSRELHHVPHFRGARRSDYAALLHISFFMFLIQLSVALADRLDTTILGFVLPDPGPANAVYFFVSKPFTQIRQIGWMLASMVMPAVASLAAAHDERGLDRVRYDGPRLHIGLILPIALLAWIYAGPFLTLWVGNRLGYDAAREAPLMRLFLIATIPLMINVQAQMAFGMGKMRVIAVSSLCGALVNIVISYVLTVRLQSVAGVIWGSVLTTFVSNFLVPGAYIFRVLKVSWRTYLARTLSAPAAGAAALIAVTWACRLLAPAEGHGSTMLTRAVPLLVHLSIGCLAYTAGYLSLPIGRRDFRELSQKLLRPRSS